MTGNFLRLDNRVENCSSRSPNFRSSSIRRSSVGFFWAHGFDVTRADVKQKTNRALARLIIAVQDGVQHRVQLKAGCILHRASSVLRLLPAFVHSSIAKDVLQAPLHIKDTRSASAAARSLNSGAQARQRAALTAERKRGSAQP